MAYRQKAGTKRRTERWLALDRTLPRRLQNLTSFFTNLYGKPNKELLLVCSPGRAEILGNHTDYNEGFTLSANITRNLLLLAKPREDALVRVASLGRGKNIVTFRIDSEKILKEQKRNYGEKDVWSNYIRGVLWSFRKRGLALSGFDAAIQSTIPVGGMSSSAALELAIVKLLCEITGITLADELLVEICKDAENNYVGAPCGYLDQGTIALADNAWLFMDHRRVDDKPFLWENVVLDMSQADCSFVVGYDPKSTHALVDGKYAKRQQLCTSSIPALQKLLIREDITALRDISSQELGQVKEQFRKAKGDKALNFITHVISENERVIEAFNRLKKGHILECGELMTESGKCAINLYELDEDAPELRFAYETVVANKKEWGVKGIRNMGGGFNATTLALVTNEKLETYQSRFNALYKQEYNREYLFVDFVPAPSVGVVNITAFLNPLIDKVSNTV
jgi:galactokinase